MSHAPSCGAAAGAGGDRGSKRPRTDDADERPQFKRQDKPETQQQQQQPSTGRPQLLLATDELRKRTGKKYCDESELTTIHHPPSPS